MQRGVADGRPRAGARCGRRPRSRSSVDSRMARCPDPTPGPRSEVHRVRSGGPEGEEERRPWKMAFWEDRSVPHPTATSPKSRNHAELVELIRGARANDPPRAPKTGPPPGGRAARSAAGPAVGVVGGGGGPSRERRPARWRTSPDAHNDRRRSTRLGAWLHDVASTPPKARGPCATGPPAWTAGARPRARPSEIGRAHV